MEKILKTYRKRLYDLTTGNRSLLFLRLSAAQELDVSALHFIDKHAAFHTIEELLTEKKSIRISSVQEPRVEQVQLVSSSLKKIYRKLAQIYEERGLYECYVGWLFAEGKWKDGTPFRAPLLFFPVKLEMESNGWFLRREEGRTIQLNKSLLLAFAHYHDLVLPDEVLEENFEDFSSDPLEFRTQIYEWLKKTKLEFLFSNEYFLNNIHPLKTYKRQEYQDRYHLGEMRIHPNAVLGIFPQAGSAIAADFDAWAENLSDTSLENFFTDRNRIKLPNDPYKEDLMTPYSMDASQEFAIREVQMGKSIVIQGPPGSGKSETICNMICSAVAAGKKILVISHKRAALEVVAKRLGQKSLDDFFALVHDVKFDQRSLYTKIEKQIEHIESYQTINNGLDAIYMEREFAASVKLLTQLNTHSEEFRNALFDTRICGFSAHELYLKASTEEGTINLSDLYTCYPAKELERLIHAVQTYSIYAAIPYPHAELWKNRIEQPDMTSQTFELWQSKASVLKQAIDDFKQQLAVYKETRIATAFEYIASLKITLESVHALLQEDSTKKLWNAFSRPVDFAKASQLIESIAVIQKENQSLFSNYSLSELHALQALLSNAHKKSEGTFGWLLYAVFSPEYKILKKAAEYTNTALSAQTLQALTDKIKSALLVEALLKETAALTDLTIPLQDTDALQALTNVIQTFYKLLQPIEETNPSLYRHVIALNAAAAEQLIKHILHAHTTLTAAAANTSAYFSTPQQLYFIKDVDLLDEWMQFTGEHLNDVQHLDALLHSLNATDRICIQRLAVLSDAYPANKWAVLIEQSVLKHWIQHIELVYPILKSLDTLRWKQFAQDWTIHSEKRKALSLEMILGKLREQTYREIVFNRLQNRITYRDLQHQVTKKKRVWPMRKLMHEYAQEVFSLIPCWMMSPEQVSCVFPLEQLFDLIIIDEASQCYTEHSLPAMYRAKQIVIAGDSQQLPPSDLYRVRWDDEEENEADIEIDSLLDLGERYLSSVLLKGHYRSRYPELIAFSNQQFYGNKLNYVPRYEDIHAAVKPITYRKVDGVWANSINKNEAEEVVRITLDYIQAGKHSIGIVCFNYQQASYIQDLLEQESVKKQFLLPEELFIKNIENVQGDERDIIIFSIGYAPDKNGKFSMLFGSLNMQGGEKRMNVAVSRARESVVLVCSIMPQELRTETLKHEGPRILKEYLQYAWDCQQFDRNAFFEKHAHTVSLASTAGRIMQVCNAHSPMQVNPVYPFATLTVTKQQAELLIDTDDIIYKNTEYAKYWHFNKPYVFTQKGWPYTQILSKNIYTKSETELLDQINTSGNSKLS
jgi:hypothetical protein